MDIRIATPDERMYTFRLSHQLSGQTGEIGYLRFDFGRNGNEFWSTFEDIRKGLKTDAFREEFDTLVNGLRRNLLRSRAHMGRLLWENYSAAKIDNALVNPEYCLRVDTAEYAYLLRLNPNEGTYSYIYCYVKKWLDGHIESAKKGIRFITSGYRTLFTIPDGGKVTLEIPGQELKTHICRYIDQTHFEFGDSLYHICEFAERVERCNGSVHPTEGADLCPSCG